MSDKNNYYITTTLPYVNSDPHIGFALEIVQADVLARYNSLLGKNVLFNYGTDEHGLKIYKKALERKKSPQDYCDEKVKKFNEHFFYNKFTKQLQRNTKKRRSNKIIRTIFQYNSKNTFSIRRVMKKNNK